MKGEYKYYTGWPVLGKKLKNFSRIFNYLFQADAHNILPHHVRRFWQQEKNFDIVVMMILNN